MSYWGYSSYVSVDEQMRMAEAYIQKARKKGTLIDPVIADDSRRKICSTWWAMPGAAISNAIRIFPTACQEEDGM